MTETVYAAETVPLLEVDGVNKTFPGVRALSDMRLDLRAGEVLALVGENGAGKSTLMKLLSGIYSADTGSFRLFGRPLTIAGPKHAMELGISIIHQEFNLVPHLTVAQNIFIGREPRLLRVLLDERRLVANARELIERLHLPLDPTALVGGLTVANQQMVEIAKALSYDPKVLIMDEPTAALNEAEVATLHELIRRFVRPDTGVIYISHRMEEIKRIADRVTVIRDGQYVDTMDVAASSTREIISLMVGRTIDGGAGPQDVRDDREVLLEVMGLSTRTLLKDVSFDLRAGEILGFAGLMGAGRTETARAIVGADPATAGTILLRGRPVRMGHPADAVRHGIGYLSEDRKRYGLLLDKDVRTNVTLGALRDRFAKAGFINDRAARAKATEYVGALKIKTPSVEQTTKFLSGGNQQKVVIAKWLVRDCEILIFDEPTRGIDVGAKEEIYDLLNQLAAQGKSIIMISSELPEVLRMSHRVVVMSEGRVTQILTAAEATQESIMHYATLRPDENVEDAMELGLDPVETGAAGTAAAETTPTGETDAGGGARAGSDGELSADGSELDAGSGERAGGLAAVGNELAASGGGSVGGVGERAGGDGELSAGGSELDADSGTRASSGDGPAAAGAGGPSVNDGESAMGDDGRAAGGGAPDPDVGEPAAGGDDREEGER